MSQSSPSSRINKTEDNINIGELIANYLKYWKWFALSIVLCGLLAVIYIKSTPPTYQIKSSILIKPESGSSSSKMGSSMLKSFGLGMSSSESVDDEIGVLVSHALTKEMVMDLGLHTSYTLKGFLKDEDLYDLTPIKATIENNILDTLSIKLTFDVKVNEKGISIKGKIDKKKLDPVLVKELPYVIHSDYGDITFHFSENPEAIIPEQSSYKLNIGIYGANRATEILQKNVIIAAKNKKTSNIITLATQDKLKNRGKLILNTLISLYNKDALNDKNETALNTEKFINERLDILTKELQGIEKTVEIYRQNNQLIDIEAESKLSLNRMADMADIRIENEIKLSVIKMIEEYINNPQNKYSLIPAGLGIPDDLSKGIVEYNELIVQRSLYLKDMHESNPAILSLNEEIGLLQKNIQKSIASVKDDLINTEKNWKKQESLIMNRLNSMPRQEREFIEIQRQLEVKTQLYLFLLEKTEENTLALASNTPKAKIIDEAYYLTKPVSPKKLLTLFLALLFGGALPILFLYLKQLLSFKIEDKPELEKLTFVPVLGEVCPDKSGQQIVVKDNETSSISELYRLIRTNIQFVLTNPEEKVILVTSSICGEGKSFFVINFSISLSLLKNKKVIMVGLDIRNPKLAEYLSMPTSKGITSFMASETMKPQEIIIQSDLHPNLSIIPAGPIPPNPAELLLTQRLDELFAYLRENYDYIIVDTAPVGMVSDTFSLKRISDATIYLCRAHYTDKSHLKLVEKIVEEDRLKKVSLVINGTKTKRYGYGYGQKK